MFERFTERARQVVVLAQDEARSLGHGYIGTEHLLLGLLREEEGIAARALRSLDVTLDGARERVTRTVGVAETRATGQIPFTPAAKETLERSLRAALDLGHTYIGTEHVLLGLLDAAPDAVGVDAESVRRSVLELLSGPGRPREPLPPPQAQMHGPPAGSGATTPCGPLYAALGLAAAAFPLGLLVGWLVWG